MRSFPLVAVLVLAACGGGTPTPDGGSGGGNAAGGSGGAGGSAAGGSGGSGGGSGGGSSVFDAGQPGETCQSAIPLSYGVISPMEKIDTAGKRMHFSVDAGAGDFLDVVTRANPGDVQGKLDTAITLLDATGATELASDDDAFPRVSTDSELFYRVRTPQVICVRVEDWSTWAGMTPVAHPTDEFRLTVTPLSGADPAVNFDAEPNDTADAGQAGKIAAFTGTNPAPGGFGFMFGGLDTASDVDVFNFTIPAGASQIQMTLPPNGDPPMPAVSTYGSTLQRFSVTVTDSTGVVVGALAPPTGMISKMSGSIGVAVTAGQTYSVTLSRPASLTAGANDFYATLADFVADNPPEVEMPGQNTNDTLATAETLTLTTNTGNAKLKDGFIFGRITSGDVDYFQFMAGASDAIALSCASVREGSGLLQPKFEIVDSGGSLQSEVETNTADVIWDTGTFASKMPVTAAAAGTFALEISATGQDATNTGNYYRCGVHITSP